MDLNEVIKTRRSIRKFCDKKVTIEQIEEIIRAAQLAPSWRNTQTAKYYAVMSEELLKMVKEECLPEFNYNNVIDAPVLILQTYVKNIAGYNDSGEPKDEIGAGWALYDQGLQTENLALKACDIGLDTLIIGSFNRKRIVELLNITDNEQAVAMLAIGYRNIEPPMPARKPLDSILTIM